MIVIVIDANIFVAAPRLRTAALRSLSDKRDDWGLTLAVPDVVVPETIANVRQRWTSTRKQVADQWRGKADVFGFGERIDDLVTAGDEFAESYESFLSERFAALGISTEPLPSGLTMDEMAVRAVEGRPPYHETSDKDGFRDTLIWLTVMKVAMQNPRAEVWLVSNNTKDFAPSPLPDPSATPSQFHPALQAELDAADLDLVFFATSLHALEHHLAARFGPIPDDELTDLFTPYFGQAIDEIRRLLLGRRIRPSRAGLSIDTVRASVIAANDDVGDGLWVLKSGARRTDGWTASFRTDPVLQLVTELKDGSDTFVTKTLRVSGEVTVRDEKMSVLIQAVAALPDDPGLEPWRAHVAERLAEAMREVQRTQDNIRHWLPRVELPGIDLPKVDVSKLDLPKVDYSLIVESMPKYDLSNLAEALPAVDFSKLMPEVDFYDFETPIVDDGVNDSGDAVADDVPGSDGEDEGPDNER